ncbi:MAG: ABC transporter substrate-binding protein [Betaproteobacteria bacterium]|nr:ABC transporter substrate-binding protein [Betaproteobacteria bacterium]
MTWVLTGVALLSSIAFADQPSTIPRIGVLNPQTASASMEDALRHGLNELGYVEGKNIKIEWRRVAGTQDEMRSLAADLVNSNVDLIVAMGSPATRAALDATAKPVVFLAGDPVASGFASSLAKPGGNATGVSVVYTELITKHLEILHELVPRARRIIVLTNFSNPGTPPSHKKLQQAAKTLGIKLVNLSASNVAEMDVAVNAIEHTRADAVLVGGDLLALANRDKIAKAIHHARLPAVFPFKQYHEAGVLISYGPNYEAAMSQIATYVDRILKGAKPSDLPIEQVSRYELVVDLRIARELGLTVPQSILLRADELIR